MEMKKHLSHYIKGFEGARDMRQKLLTSDDADWVLKTLEEIQRSLPERDNIPLAV
jgi:tRNA-dihydrouridine synthase